MLWIRSHTKYAVNNGQLSSMNVLQVVCQKPHGAKPMASPINILLLAENSPVVQMADGGIIHYTKEKDNGTYCVTKISFMIVHYVENKSFFYVIDG